MSKARRRPNDEPMKQLCFLPEAPQRSADDVDADVIRALSELPESLPGEIVEALRRVAEGVSGKYDAATEWDSFKANAAYVAPRRRTVGGANILENEFISDLVLRAAKAGFWLALQRYAKHLQSSQEAMGFIKAREAAGERGRTAQSNRKQSRQREAKVMLEQGIGIKDIARHLGADASTVYRWLQPSSAAAPSRRKSGKR